MNIILYNFILYQKEITPRQLNRHKSATTTPSFETMPPPKRAQEPPSDMSKILTHTMKLVRLNYVYFIHYLGIYYYYYIYI